MVATNFQDFEQKNIEEVYPKVSMIIRDAIIDIMQRILNLICNVEPFSKLVALI